MLIRQLPADAALWRSLEPEAAWTPTEHLLALAVDYLAAANWQRAAQGSKSPPPKPLPLPRPGRTLRPDEPGVTRTVGTPMTPEAFAEFRRRKQEASHAG